MSKSQYIQIRCTEEEKESLNAFAESKGMSLSRYMVSASMGQIKGSDPLQEVLNRCKDCPNRAIGCHSTCIYGILQNAYFEHRRKQKRKEAEENNFHTELSLNMDRKMKQSKHKAI